MKDAMKWSLVMLLLTAPPLSATSPTERATVSLVEIPVYVYDKQGHPVTDLSEQEVAVYEDGKRQTLEMFIPIRAREGTAMSPPPAPQTAPAIESLLLPRNFVLLLDFWMNSEPGIERMHGAALDFVKVRMRDADQAAVFAVTPAKGLGMLANFTSDRSLLATSIESLWQRGIPRAAPDSAGLFLARPAVQDYWFGSRISAPPWSPAAYAMPLNDDPMPRLRYDPYQPAPVLEGWSAGGPTISYTSERDPLVAYLRNLERLARAVAAYPGRKVLLMFSEGYDTNQLLHPDPYPAPSADLLDSMMRSNEYVGPGIYGWPSAKLVELATRVPRLLASADSQVYALDTVPPRCVLYTGIYGRSAWSCQAALFRFADETGGKLYKDYENMGTSMDDLIDRTGSYYLLGYRPPEPQAGQEVKYHRLKVKVQRKGLRIQYRRGYFDPAPADHRSIEEKNMELAAVLNEQLPGDRIRLNARAIAYPGDDLGCAVAVAIEIPMAQFGRSPEEAYIEIFGFASSTAGVVDGYLHGQYLLTRDAAPSAGLRYQDVMFLPPGKEYELRFIARNERTGEIGAESITVLTQRDLGGFSLAPPVFPIVKKSSQSTDWINALGFDPRQPPERLAVHGARFPVAFDGKVFNFEANTKVQGGDRRPVLLRLLHLAGEPSDVRFTFVLTDSSGVSRPVSPVRTESAAGDSRSAVDFLVEIDIPPLPRGTYQLGVVATDAASGASAQAHAEIEVQS